MNNIRYEPFWAAFTGQLAVYTTQEGHRCSFQKPYPYIRKDRAYMLKVDMQKRTAHLLVVISPDEV